MEDCSVMPKCWTIGPLLLYGKHKHLMYYLDVHHHMET